ncbi:T9SS C-terminal target domain-containing protein [Sphingobacteriales bacterium UPWRP_1]|nr:hypothetical protein B6N25_00915 [Sphingobacteriales bacterium TSM_CSS]PSJ72433.1 T9SS C-terminal target domain-containing protein [Sphingobacteriales bacterium UPWRP_1]
MIQYFFSNPQTIQIMKTHSYFGVIAMAAIICCCICFFSLNSQAQNFKYYVVTPIWEDNLNCNGLSIVQNSNDTYSIAGSTLDPYNTIFRAFLAEIDNNGNFINFFEYPKSDTLTYARGLEVDLNKNNYFIGGGVEDTSQTGRHAYYFLINFNGDVINEGIVSNGFQGYETLIYSTCQAIDGGYLMAGISSISPSIGVSGYVPYHPYLVKLDSLGNKQWEKLYEDYGPPLYAWFTDIKPALNGSGYYLVGTNHGGGTIGDVLLLKIDADGNELWHQILDFVPFEEEFIDEQGMSILPTSDGGLLLTAIYNDYDPFQGCCSPFVVGKKGVFVKTDSLGNVLWDTIRITEDDDSEELISFVPQAGIYETAAGDFVTAGIRLPLAGDLDGEIVKVSKNGEVLWRRTYDASGFDDYFYDMTATLDGGYIMCGRSETYLPPWGMVARLFIVKTNCMGLLTQPQAAFSYYPLDNHAIQFINETQYAYPDSIDGGYYVWDFGDGSPPHLCGQGYAPCTGITLTHQYAAPGSYPVTLTAIVCSDTSVVQALIDTQGAGGTVGIAPQNSPPVEGLGVVEVLVYPNPAQNTLQIIAPLFKGGHGGVQVFFYTLTGQTVLETTLAAGEASKTISVAHLPAGIYLCRWQQSAGGAWGYIKVVIVR